MKKCIFCEIVKGKSPAHKIYEDKLIFAFLDKHPINPGHILVIPKKHIVDFFKLDTVAFTHLMLAVKKLSQTVNELFKPKKVGLVVAGLGVPHVHVHIVPMRRFHDITSQSLLEGRQSNPSRVTLAKIARTLTKGI